jgi:hypothetical protein
MFFIFLEFRWVIPLLVEFVRLPDDLLGTDRNTEVTPLAQFLVDGYMTFDFLFCLCHDVFRLFRPKSGQAAPMTLSSLWKGMVRETGNEKDPFGLLYLKPMEHEKC